MAFKIWGIVVLIMWIIDITWHFRQKWLRHHRPHKIVTYLHKRKEELEAEMKHGQEWPIDFNAYSWPRYKEVIKTLKYLEEL